MFEFEIKGLNISEKRIRFSVNDDEYLIDEDGCYTKVDLSDFDIESGPIYKKVVEVQAEQLSEEEEILTIIDEREETVNTAEPGDWIVTNPGGERYVMDNESFEERYSATDRPGIFISKGFVRMIRNPLKRCVFIDAPWGSEQKAGPNCVFVVGCHEGGRLLSKISKYLIDEVSFRETYVSL